MLEKLHERALRSVFQDKENGYQHLLNSKSIRYFGPKIWNFLDDNLRTQPDLQSFKKSIQHVKFENL